MLWLTLAKGLVKLAETFGDFSWSNKRWALSIMRLACSLLGLAAIGSVGLRGVLTSASAIFTFFADAELASDDLRFDVNIGVWRAWYSWIFDGVAKAFSLLLPDSSCSSSSSFSCNISSDARAASFNFESKFIFNLANSEICLDEYLVGLGHVSVFFNLDGVYAVWSVDNGLAMAAVEFLAFGDFLTWCLWDNPWGIFFKSSNFASNSPLLAPVGL